MKIISWNLRNIAGNKLSKTFGPRYSGYGLGGNGLDYITKLVTGDPAWSNITSPTPADVFVIIELKTGGKRKMWLEVYDGAGQGLVKKKKQPLSLLRSEHQKTEAGKTGIDLTIPVFF